MCDCTIEYGWKSREFLNGRIVYCPLHAQAESRAALVEELVAALRMMYGMDELRHARRAEHPYMLRVEALLAKASQIETKGAGHAKQ